MISVSQKFPSYVKSLFQRIYSIYSILRCYSSLLSQKNPIEVELHISFRLQKINPKLLILIYFLLPLVEVFF